MTTKQPRSSWPSEEWGLWFRPGYLEPDFDVRNPSDEDGLDAAALFIHKIRHILEAHVEEFITERCSERRVEGPNLRRIARVVLWQALNEHDESMMIESSASAREAGLPWSMLSEVTHSKGPSNFRRRWGAEVEEAIVNRSLRRDEHGTLYGDTNYTTPEVVDAPRKVNRHVATKTPPVVA